MPTSTGASLEPIEKASLDELQNLQFDLTYT